MNIKILKNIIKKIIIVFKKIYYRIIFRYKKNIKIVVGASNTKFKGWSSTDKDILDITKEDDWKKLFGKKEIDNILAEHVFEHLNEEGAKQAFINISLYLKKGGTFRFAVPDGNHPSAYLRQLIGINGKEKGAEDHKIYFSINNITKFFKEESFQVNPIEYFDKNGTFHTSEFDKKNGYIKRCSLNNSGRYNNKEEYDLLIESVPYNLREQFKNIKYPSTSLFIDFIKK